MMLAFLASLGLSKRVAQAVVYLGLPLLLLAALWLALHLYGNSRYHAGYAANEAKWQAASQKLKDEAAKSATKADDAAAKRLEQFEALASLEQKELDDATANGSSVFDVMFHP